MASEPTSAAGCAPRVNGRDLDSADGAAAADPGEHPELAPHHRLAADFLTQRRLADDHVDIRPAFTEDRLLPG